MPLIKNRVFTLSLFFSLLTIWGVISCIQNAAIAAELTIDESFKVAAINNSSTNFVAHKSMTYFDILAPSEALPTAVALDNHNSRLWLSTEITHSGYSTIPLVLNIDRLNLNDLQIYLLDGNARIIKSYRYQAGKGDYSLTNPFPAIRMSFSIAPQDNIRLLIGVQDDGMRTFPISLWEKHEIQDHDTAMLVLLGVVIGLLTLLCGYSFLAYLFQRTPSRFWLMTTLCLLFILLFLSQGGLAIWPTLTNTSEIFLSIILGMILLMLAKVMHNLFTRIPLYLRFINLLLPLAMSVTALCNDAYHATLILFVGVAIIGVYQVFLAFVFKEKNNIRLSRLFAFSWVCLFILHALFTEVIFNNLLYTVPVVMAMIALLSLALLCISFSVELKEQHLNKQQLTENEATITNLHHFYDLFRNSAEGLYTSTLDGYLKTVNPAMCALFGYENESDMLSNVDNTKQFYVNVEDRDLLVGELLESGKVMRREIQGIRSTGEKFWFSISCQVRQSEGSSFLYGSIIDVTEKKQSDISLQYIATHDSLTGVFNRRKFESTLKLKLTERDETPLCILYIDIDRFKIVNDTCGHKAGDALVKDIAQLLEKTLSDKIMLARLGGDEFGIIFSSQSEEEVYQEALNILNAVHTYQFIWDKRIFNLGVSVGMVVCDDDQTPAEQYLGMADAACYIAKEQGRNQVHRYNKNDMSMQRYQGELDWVTKVNNALSENGFVLYYQPLRPLTKPNDGYYYEILLRLLQSDGSIIEPAAFLPTVERFEMNVRVDKWVITNTFAWLSQHQEHLNNLKRCSINLNCHSLADRDFKLFVLNAFESFGIPYEKICFEVIESVAIIRMDDTISFMNSFSELGCSFALDDFGSGFSSYRYLKSLPVDMVKIDGTFIREMLSDPINSTMVASIKDVAKAMGMMAVGECVESDAVMTQLGKMGVDFAQGFSIAEPAPLTEFKPL